MCFQASLFAPERLTLVWCYPFLQQQNHSLIFALLQWPSAWFCHPVQMPRFCFCAQNAQFCEDACCFRWREFGDVG